MRRKGMSVGYCEDSKSFRIYIPDQKKVEISSNVTFDEDVALGEARDLPPPPPPKSIFSNSSCSGFRMR